MLPPGFLRAFPGLGRTPDPAAAETAEDSGRFRDVFVYAGVFAALLLIGQFLLGHALILTAMGPLGYEAENRAALIAGWNELASQRERMHARHVAALARRDQTARAFASADPQKTVSEYLDPRRDSLDELDLLLAVDERNRVLYGDAKLRDRKLEKEFLEITGLKVRDLSPEREDPASAPGVLEAATGPLFWHYYTAHGEHVYLLTLAAICDDDGYPIEKGFLLFGERLESLLESARRQLNLKSAHITPEKPVLAYASARIPGYQSEEAFYVALEPRTSAGGLARRVLHALLLLEAIVAFAILGYGLPHFYRGPAELKKRKRTKGPGKTNGTKGQEKSKASAKPPEKTDKDADAVAPDAKPQAKPVTNAAARPTPADATPEAKPPVDSESPAALSTATAAGESESTADSGSSRPKSSGDSEKPAAAEGPEASAPATSDEPAPQS
ncbi:MAG: hypothetical protein NXI24_12445 [bacterium]|nr:hypothetical protein [bacterium]